MTDVKQQQLWSVEQAILLEALAASVAARRDPVFLEVGSWCGDSAVILGRVARARRGRLFCIDWWRGSAGTELADLAATTDIFSIFWRRISDEGLADVVVPIRGRSESVIDLLKPESCDLVFLDGDHRHGAVAQDIRAYAPLVRRGGILCGHDCDGRAEDYERDFLLAGRDQDVHESVHCGVVLAVSDAFPEYTVRHGVWSVQCNDTGVWQPTTGHADELSDLTHGPVPPIAWTRDYGIVRYGRFLYALPNTMQDADIRVAAVREDPAVVRSANLSEMERLLHQGTVQMPVLVETHRDFNLVAFAGSVTALAVKLGPFDLRRASATRLSELANAGLCVRGSSVVEVKAAIDGLLGVAPPSPPGAGTSVATIESLEQRIDAVANAAVDRAAVDAVAGAVAALQRDLAQLTERAVEQQAVREVRESIEALSRALEQSQGRGLQLTESIRRLETVLALAVTRLDGADQAIAGQDRRLSPLEERLARVEQAMTRLKAGLSASLVELELRALGVSPAPISLVLPAVDEEP